MRLDKDNKQQKNHPRLFSLLAPLTFFLFYCGSNKSVPIHSSIVNKASIAFLSDLCMSSLHRDALIFFQFYWMSPMEHFCHSNPIRSPLEVVYNRSNGNPTHPSALQQGKSVTYNEHTKSTSGCFTRTIPTLDVAQRIKIRR